MLAAMSDVHTLCLNIKSAFFTTADWKKHVEEKYKVINPCIKPWSSPSFSLSYQHFIKQIGDGN